MASTIAPRTASPTLQELRMDRLERAFTCSFEKIFDRLDAADSARAQLDATAATAVGGGRRRESRALCPQSWG